MSYKREILKLNRDNFVVWKGLMRLHLAKISDLGCKYLDTEHKTLTRTLSIENITEKKNNNIMMVDIASSLNYVEFDEVKDCQTAHEMWTKLKDIYGGDDNVRRAKLDSVRAQFDQMKMGEDENIAKYVEGIKASVSTIKVYGGDIKDETIVRY